MRANAHSMSRRVAALVGAGPATLSQQAALAARSASTFVAAAPALQQERPRNVGILAMETHFPKTFVAQESLEVADGVSAGKYTIGLGQTRMAFTNDLEDINSVCLTAVANLLEKYNISPMEIGRLEVGTESLVDKSKSTKTTLMKLFEDAGNRDIEGATCINACYGGTAALLNSLAWVESSEWDGRYALVVAGDLAVYEAGPARPTGGAGVVACLVGPEAPLRVVPGTRVTHATDVYDFYKADLSSEFPQVDGKLSQSCYIRAVDDCYNRHMDKLERITKWRSLMNTPLQLQDAYDHFVFHSPYNKLVQQSYARLFFNDMRRAAAAGAPMPEHLKPLEAWAETPYADTVDDRDIMKASMEVAKASFNDVVGPSSYFSQNIGNSYTAAVFCNLLSLVSDKGEGLTGKRIGVFSYGSGAIASMYTLEGRDPEDTLPEAVEAAVEGGAYPYVGERPLGMGLVAKRSPREDQGFSIGRIRDTVKLRERLDARTEASPEIFTETMNLRQASYGKAGYKPVSDKSTLWGGAYYLDEVGFNHTRTYKRMEEAER